MKVYEQKSNKEIEDLFFSDPQIEKRPVSPSTRNVSKAGGGGGGSEAIIAKADKLGLLVVEPAVALERESEINSAMSLLRNNENVMMLGEAGTGKTTVVQDIARRLKEEGKTVVEVPSTYFTGGTVGKISDKIESLITAFTPAELKNIVFFMDEIHSIANQGTFGTGEQDQETPRNLLKPYLVGNSNSRLVVIGATTTQEYRKRIEEVDPAFARRFQNITLNHFTLDQIQRVLLDKTVMDGFKKVGFSMSESQYDLNKYKQITEYGCLLLDKFARYQAFPEKSAKFFKRLFAGKTINDITQEKIESLISETLNIPIELVTQEFKRNSVFLSLEDSIKDNIIGQDNAVETISSKILRFVQDHHNQPLSFLAVGDSGVGKTQTVEEVSKALSLPIIKFNMGEYKTKETTEDFVNKLTAYIKGNYTGIILFDELEKANTEVLDTILSLTDKGQIGSGQSLVTAKSQIIFMTSNIIKDSLNDLETVLKEDGIHEIPDKLLRQVIESETDLRTEFIGRVSSVLHYKKLSPEVSLEIARKVLDKKIKSYEGNGIDFEISQEAFEKIAGSAYESLGGVRMIGKNIDQFFEKILSNKDVITVLKNQVFVGEINKMPNIIHVNIEKDKILLNVNNTDIVINNKKQVDLNIDSVLERVRKLRNQGISERKNNKPTL